MYMYVIVLLYCTCTCVHVAFSSLSLQAWVQAKVISKQGRAGSTCKDKGWWGAVDHAVMCSLYFSGETFSFHCLNKVLVHIYNGVYAT